MEDRLDPVAVGIDEERGVIAGVAVERLRALQIEESAKEIRKRVEELGRHLGSYDEYMRKLGAHLTTTVGAYNKASRELKKVDKDVLRISGEGAGIEAELIAPPADDEEG